MPTSQEGAPERAEPRSRIEDMLARYPDLPPEQVAELIGWFTREASALDVALIASNEAIRPGYTRFRAEHVDRFKLKDAAWAAFFASVVLGVIVLIGIWSL